MSQIRRYPFATALVAWSLLVWTTRIGNIWNDSELTTGEQWGRTALALSFTVLALTVGVEVLRQAAWQPLAVRALAGWTVAVWVVRSFGITTANHDVAFVVVHLVLAAVSIVLSVLAVREVAPRRAADDAGPPDQLDGIEPVRGSRSVTQEG